MKKITKDDLIQFIYHELSLEEELEVAAAIKNDWNLNEEYQMLKETVEDLSKISYAPSNQSVENILKLA